MATDPSDATLAEFSRWALTTTRKLSGDPDADATELRLLLDLMRDHLALDDPAALVPGNIENLLLYVYPRKVAVMDPAQTQQTVPALRDLLAFLTETKRLPARAGRLLVRELDQVAPSFAELDYEEEEYDVDLKEAFGLPDRLPAMRLPAEGELAAVARKTTLLTTASALAEWAGTGRPVNEDGKLTVADTVAAAAELGLEIADRPDGDPLPGMPALPDITSMRDMPELVHLWNLALGAGFLEPTDNDTRFASGPAVSWWREGTDAEALAIWSDALTFMVTDSLEIDADLDLRRGEELDFYGAGAGLLVLLFLARSEGLQAAEADDLIRDVATSELSAVGAMKTWAAWTKAHGEPGSVLLRRLTQLGAVTLDDGHDGPDGSSGSSGSAEPVVRLTPLGSWAVREQLAEAGVEVPLLPPPAEMTAADLVTAAEGVDEDEIAAEADAWLAHRAPDAAARELLEFAAQGSPVERLIAITAVQRIGAAAEPRWRDALEIRAVRPYAKIALAEIIGGSPEAALLAGLEPEPDDVAWLVTDLLAAASQALEPEDLAIQLGEAVPTGAEELMFGVMSRLPHPDAARVLTLIGKHHPDKKVAKEARRSAYKANGRLASVR